MKDWNVIIFEYVCPSVGVLISSALYSAPVNDLRKALSEGHLGHLNPAPWAVMSGNCFGWLTYSFFARDPFILASNIPGMLVSVWLNVGASKLQYHSEMELSNEIAELTDVGDRTSPAAAPRRRKGSLALSPQDVLWLRILSVWIVILVCVGWFGLADGHEKETVGILVNINLLFFYGAPLQRIRLVTQESNSDSLHVPTMVLSCTNAAFWMMYGIARRDIVVYGPNGIGLILGFVQALLCCVYPKSTSLLVNGTPLLEDAGLVEDGTAEEGEASSGMSIV
jgi:solute carrier family 50 protein (sugar transporter)